MKCGQSEAKFATDSPLEREGFELAVLAKGTADGGARGLSSPIRERIWRIRAHPGAVAAVNPYFPAMFAARRPPAAPAPAMFLASRGHARTKLAAARPGNTADRTVAEPFVDL
jgi:hypothetical protein